MLSNMKIPKARLKKWLSNLINDKMYSTAAFTF